MKDNGVTDNENKGLTDDADGEKKDPEKKKRDLRNGIIIAAFAIVGGLLSVASFLLFFRMQNVAWTVGICIVDVIYAYINANVFFKDREWRVAKRFFIPMMMVMYYIVVFTVIIIGAVCFKFSDYTDLFFLYPVFLFPSFILVITVLILFLMALSYA